MQIQIKGLDKAIKDYKEYRDSLKNKLRTLMERLAEIGIVTAELKLQTVVYDGTNDMKINSVPKWIDENKLAISAKGNSVAFIEFGTGVVYADDHPKAADVGAIRGAYGKGKGKQTTWGYYGDPGTNGITIEKKKGKAKGKTVVLTHGNPANRVLYDAGKEMRNQIVDIAREVFMGDRS